MDILLFVPYVQWGGWIVLGATILLTSSGVVTCAMRRTLVSRKARKRRIAENAEMNGENFYNRQNVVKLDVPPLGSRPDPPGPGTTTINVGLAQTGVFREDVSIDRRSPPVAAGYSERSLSPPDNIYAPVQQTPYDSSYAMQSDPTLRNQFSSPSMRSNRSEGPMYPPRGRGGYLPRGRGRPYGPPGFAGNGRGRPRIGPPNRGRGGPPGYPPQNRGYPQNEYTPYGNGPAYGGPGQYPGPGNVNQGYGEEDIEMVPPGTTLVAPNDTRQDPNPVYVNGSTGNLERPTSVYSTDM